MKKEAKGQVVKNLEGVVDANSTYYLAHSGSYELTVLGSKMVRSAA